MDIAVAIAKLQVMKSRNPHEPVFLLRARDVLAAPTIAQWIQDAQAAGVNEPKLTEARACLSDFHLWPEKRKPD